MAVRAWDDFQNPIFRIRILLPHGRPARTSTLEGAASSAPTSQNHLINPAARSLRRALGKCFRSNSCSQMRTTFQPFCRRILFCLLSRALFPLIFTSLRPPPFSAPPARMRNLEWGIRNGKCAPQWILPQALPGRSSPPRSGTRNVFRKHRPRPHRGHRLSSLWGKHHHEMACVVFPFSTEPWQLIPCHSWQIPSLPVTGAGT